jgi:hypothetical protein
MHFSLIKINPEGTPPSHGFDDVILPLHYALRSLGFQTEIRFNSVNPASRNIVFGSCIAPRRTGRSLPPGSIIFNLEQMNQNSMWRNRDYLAHLRDFPVWDYSLANIRALAELGVTGAAHLPLGYVPEMTRLAPDHPTDIDMLFYGWITDRRDTLIRRLAASGIPILATQEAFGHLRDRLLAHSRLVLNIHQHLPARLEVARLGYVWANKKPVLSEWREDGEMPDYLREACVYATYEAIPETAARLLHNPALLRRQAERGFAAFASRPMAAGLEKLVGRRAHAAGFQPAAPSAPPREWLIQGDTPRAD